MTVIPSILTADFTNINDDLRIFKSLGLNEIHLDVMDGQFVENLTFGPKYIKDIKDNNKDLIYDTHLMILNPEKHVKEYIESGSNKISIHLETVSIRKIKQIAKEIKDTDCDFGIAINPETNIKRLEKILKEVDIDFVIVMSVHPGAGGQRFIEDTFSRIEKIQMLRDKYDKKFEIEIDGGVNIDNFKKLCDLSVERIVIGSGLYKDRMFEENYKKFQEQIK